MDEERRQIIEAAVSARGLQVRAWKNDEDGDEVALLGRFMVIEDEGDEDLGIYDGEHGVLSADIVGTPQHRNQRVAYLLTVDETDVGVDIPSLDMLEEIDEDLELDVD